MPKLQNRKTPEQKIPDSITHKQLIVSGRLVLNCKMMTQKTYIERNQENYRNRDKISKWKLHLKCIDIGTRLLPVDSQEGEEFCSVWKKRLGINPFFLKLRKISQTGENLKLFR